MQKWKLGNQGLEDGESSVSAGRGTIRVPQITA